MSSSSNEENPELKAGHPPAVKVAGGMRITQHKPPQEKQPEVKPTGDENEDEEEVTETSPKKEVITVNVSGALVSGNHDYPAAAVKAIHEKQGTVPSKEYRPMNKKNIIIHQPSKQ